MSDEDAGTIVDHLAGPAEPRGSEEFAWVTTHVFRRTAATELDRAGLSARVIADQLGHAKGPVSGTWIVQKARR